jgi:predicted nucleic acid-binding protein
MTLDQAETGSVVITDTSVLINLLHTGHLSLLGRTPGYRFLVSEEVLAEVQDSEQKDLVDRALSGGFLEIAVIETAEELATYTELTLILGSGESACLALASSRGWLIACDERRVFLREARARIGEQRLINTPGLYLLWIHSGILTVDEADAAKVTLESRRFKMGFRSFRDLV